MSDTCATCRFFDVIHGKAIDYGRCRRVSPGRMVNGQFPFVRSDGTDWCGEHQPKAETQDTADAQSSGAS